LAEGCDHLTILPRAVRKYEVEQAALFAAKLNNHRYAEKTTAAFRPRKGNFQLLRALSTHIPPALLFLRQLGYFRHATDEFLLNDVRFVGLHFLPPDAFLPRATAAKTPATGASKFTNIDAGALTFFHGPELIV